MRFGKDHNITEEQIILKLKEGNILAFNYLFDKYSSKLYIFSYGYLKSIEDAESLVQDVFIKIWEKRKELNPHLSFKAFIFTIAYNAIKKHFRKSAQFRRFANSGLVEEITTETSQTVDYNSLKNHVFDIVKNLPEKRRIVFIKSRFEGFTNKEIAEDLGLSKKTVENHLNLAIKQIKRKLEGGDLSMVLFFSVFEVCDN